MTAMSASPAYHAADQSAPLLEGTVGEALLRTAERFPDRNAVAYADGEGVAAITYAELVAKARQVAWWLQQFGRQGDAVAIWSRNCVEWVILEFGCALAGRAIAGWNPAWTDPECEHAYRLTDPVVVLAGCDTRGVSLLDRARRIGGERVFSLDDLEALSAGAAPRPLPQLTASDVFLIQFTSGTTGRAKGAALSHGAALNGAWLRVHAMGVDETDVLVNPSPMSHIGGAIHMLLGAMVTGACYVMMKRFEVGEYVRMMRLCGATQISGVPTMLLAILDHPEVTPGSVKLRSIASGGTLVPEPLIERLTREFGAPVFVCYAQSETPMVSTTMPSDSAALLATTVGRPAPHVELRIAAPDGGPTLPRGEVGEICVRGPMIMNGYHGMAKETAGATDAEGFLRTGDLGSLDEAGYLRIAGRCRDVIIRGGENIYPAEVEDALLEHPDVGLAAVVGVPDERWGQQVAAAVLPREGSHPDPAALEAHLAGRIAHFKVPRRWMFVDQMPLTPSGKIRKVDVESMFAPAVKPATDA
jgi:fatty-acyl-CoA synthase